MDRRPKYTGALGGTVGIAQSVAPTLGGVLTDRLSWSESTFPSLLLLTETYRVVFLDQSPLRGCHSAYRHLPRAPPQEPGQTTHKRLSIPRQIRSSWHPASHPLGCLPAFCSSMGRYRIPLGIVAHHPPPGPLRRPLCRMVRQPSLSRRQSHAAAPHIETQNHGRCSVVHVPGFRYLLSGHLLYSDLVPGCKGG